MKTFHQWQNNNNKISLDEQKNYLQQFYFFHHLFFFVRWFFFSSLLYLLFIAPSSETDAAANAIILLSPQLIAHNIHTHTHSVYLSDPNVSKLSNAIFMIFKKFQGKRSVGGCCAHHNHPPTL